MELFAKNIGKERKICSRNNPESVRKVSSKYDEFSAILTYSVCATLVDPACNNLESVRNIFEIKNFVIVYFCVRWLPSQKNFLPFNNNPVENLS